MRLHNRLFIIAFLLMWLILGGLLYQFGGRDYWLWGGLLVAGLPAFLFARLITQWGIPATQNAEKLADKSEEQLNLSQGRQQQLEALLGALESGVLLVDAHGQVIRCNRAAEKLLKMAEKQLLGRTVAEVTRHHQLIELWQDCYASGEAGSLTLEFVRQKKPLFWQVSITPFSSASKHNYLLLIQDLTELRRLQIVRRDFVSNVSHELRTPLASVRAVVETLQDGALADPKTAHRFLGRAQVDLDTMTQTVEELQELARIESGQVPLQMEKLSITDLILPAVERFQPLAEREQVALSVDVSGKLPHLLADPNRISQVLTNLIHNSIKFTPSGGEIIIRAEKNKQMIELSVTDTGVGIPATDISRIFERFYKADRARSGGGTGLGLAIARHLVEAHGGKIWAKSKVGKGTVFTFSLPIDSAEDTELLG